MSSHEPPISAVDAIKFAVEKIDDGTATDFLNSWLHGDWEYLRDNWPEAFDSVPAPEIPEYYLTDHHAEASQRTVFYVAIVMLLAVVGAWLLRDTL